MFFSAIVALVERAQALMGHWVETRSARQLPEPQSQSLALPSLETAAKWKKKKMTIHRHICMHVHVYLKVSHFSYYCMLPSNSLFGNLEVNKFYCLNTTCTHTQPLTDNIPSAVYNGCICDSCKVKNRIHLYLHLQSNRPNI